MAKTNNTLLYAGLGLAALLIFKKKSASVGATRYYQFSPEELRLQEEEDRLIEEWQNNPRANVQYIKQRLAELERLQNEIYSERWYREYKPNNIGMSKQSSIIISGSRRLAADAFFCFEKYTSYKNDKRGNASTLILSYPTESKAREELNKGMQYLISRYPNYIVEEVKYTGNTKVFYVIDSTTNERISIYIY